MAKILDNVEMAQPVLHPNEPQAEHRLPCIEEARNAARDFLNRTIPDVRQVNIVKLALMDPQRGGWEAEADVHVPNPTIRALGLPLQKEVLDCETYLLRLDRQLHVAAFGLRDSVEQKASAEM